MIERRILAIGIFVFIITLGGCYSYGPGYTLELVPRNWFVSNYYVPKEVAGDYKIAFLLTSRFDSTSNKYSYEPYFEVIPKYKLGSPRPIGGTRLKIENIILSNDSMHILLHLTIDSTFEIMKTIGIYSIGMDKIALSNFRLDSLPDSLRLDYTTSVIDNKRNIVRYQQTFQNYVVPYRLGGGIARWATRKPFTNPFSPTTNILYDLATSGPVMVIIYNIEGQVVDTLVNEVQDIGEYEVTWDALDMNGRSLPSGIYFYKIITPDTSVTHKMVLMR